MEGKFELQFEDSEYYLVDGNSNDTVATTDKVLLKKYDGYMKKLSLKNCEAIANGYDLDELAVLCTKEETSIVGNQKMAQGFIKGFKKALEILGDKKFSEKDMRRALSAGLSIGYGRQFEIENKQVEIDSYIKSLQQTEWDVEVEMEEVLNMDYKPSFGGGSDSHYNPMYVSQPKLDADGCLILKRK